MSTSSSHLQGTLYAFLTTHIGKVEIKGVLVVVKLLTCINNGRFAILGTIQKGNHISDILHAVHLKLVYHSRFAHILLGNYQALKLLFACTDGYRQHTAYGFQFAIQAQLAYHHIILQCIFCYLAVGSQYTNSQWQIVATTLFTDIGRTHINCQIGCWGFITNILDSCANTVVTLFYCGVGQARQVKRSASCQINLDGYGGCFECGNGCTIGFNKHCYSINSLILSLSF